MTKKIGDKKLGGVKGATETPGIDSTKAVSQVGQVKPTTGVGAVGGAGAIGKRRATRVMTVAEREQLLQMINEEAEKIFSSGVLPDSKKEVVTQAVKMAVDASLLAAEDLDEEEEKEGSEK